MWYQGEDYALTYWQIVPTPVCEGPVIICGQGGPEEKMGIEIFLPSKSSIPYKLPSNKCNWQISFLYMKIDLLHSLRVGIENLLRVVKWAPNFCPLAKWASKFFSRKILFSYGDKTMEFSLKNMT